MHNHLLQLIYSTNIKLQISPLRVKRHEWSVLWIQVHIGFCITLTDLNLVNRWTTKYYVQYSDDNTKWKLHKSRFERQYMTTFEGNQDHRFILEHSKLNSMNKFSDIKLNTFDPPLEARYVKIVPTKAFKQGSAALRIELFGNKM